MNLVATDLILKDGISDILRNFRHGLNIIVTLVILGTDATIEYITSISDQP